MNIIMKFSDRLSGILLFRVLRRGMILLIPVVLVASVVQALIALPIPEYEDILKNFLNGTVYAVLSYVRDFSFSYFSVMLAIAISISYVMEKDEPFEISMFAPPASCAAFLLISRISAGGEEIKLGTQGSFWAIVIAFCVSAAYVRMMHSGIGHIFSVSPGHDMHYRGAMRAIPVMLIIMICAAFVSYVLYDILGIDNITSWLGTLFESLVGRFNGEFSISLICTSIIHLLWFFGIHGSNVMENVMTAHMDVGSGIIFSKTFFDCYVVMGGCGTSVCIIAAILLFSKYKKFKNLARSAIFPVMLNINEIITFGLPIIWNPIMFIPFMLVPLECVLIAFAAFKFGLVSPIVSEVMWTTPIFISGYIATGGTIGGAVLQAVNIAVGTATYIPFIRAYETFDAERTKKHISKMVEEIRSMEENGDEVSFLERKDEIGVAANMLMEDLKQAIEDKELYFLYQPQFEADGACMGAEALIRWEHPAAGFIYPPLIIYLAKKGGFLSRLEEHIFDMACRAIKETSEKTNKDFKISVNLTAKSLRWAELEKCIDENLLKYEVGPEKLWIEITEQDIISKDDEITGKIARLRDKGHKFLIDDFGMGKTSILYLQTSLFDCVKLDGSLIKTIISSEPSREIVSSIIDLSGKLGVKVIAEYVETKEECELLDGLGCNWYQGYYFSKPVPLSAFTDRLNNQANEDSGKE